MFASSVTAPISKVRRLAAAALLLIAGTATSNAAEEEVISWLEEMSLAIHQLSYVGTFVYQQGDNLQIMRIIRSVTEEGEHERLIAMSGQTREVIRTRDKVTCILPEDSSIVVEQSNSPRPFSAIPVEQLAILGEYYEIRLAGTERIAGMVARQINITPRDQYRFGQRLWLDEQTRLLLRTEVFNEHGEIIEKLLFTSLEVLEQVPPEMLEPEIGERDQVVELDKASPLRRTPRHSPAGWQVMDLPPGFRQKVLRSHFLPNKFNQVEHHVYSDGLASVSVFIEQRDEEDEALSGPSRLGGVNVYAQSHDDYQITVLGEVPLVTVRQIAESMARVARQ